MEPLWCPLDGRLLWALQRKVSVPSQLEVEVTLVPEAGLDGADDLQTVRIDQRLTDSNSYIPVISNMCVCVCGGGGGEYACAYSINTFGVCVFMCNVLC